MSLLVLASASPRRREYLSRLGVAFEVAPADVDETPQGGEPAEAYARRVAGEKAAAVAGQKPGRWVLAADTVVVVDGDILGKPLDRDDARHMLSRLSGRKHRVCTAVVLRMPEGRSVLDEVVETEVEMRELSAAEIAAYVASGESDDKAGAYAIQGDAAAFVRRIDGSHSNVVGLPLEVVENALRHAGLLSEAPGPRP